MYKQFKIKRLLAICLSSLMLTTSLPFTSLADPIHQSSNTDTKGNGSTAGTINKSTGYSANQAGVRITLVDKEGNRVGDSLDVLFSNPSGNIKYMNASAAKNDGYGTNIEGGSVQPISASAIGGYLAKITGDSTPPTNWLNQSDNGKSGDSTSWKEWFQNDSQTAAISGSAISQFHNWVFNVPSVDELHAQLPYTEQFITQLMNAQQYDMAYTEFIAYGEMLEKSGMYDDFLQFYKFMGIEYPEGTLRQTKENGVTEFVYDADEITVAGGYWETLEYNTSVINISDTMQSYKGGGENSMWAYLSDKSDFIADADISDSFLISTVTTKVGEATDNKIGDNSTGSASTQQTSNIDSFVSQIMQSINSGGTFDAATYGRATALLLCSTNGTTNLFGLDRKESLRAYWSNEYTYICEPLVWTRVGNVNGNLTSQIYYGTFRNFCAAYMNNCFASIGVAGGAGSGASGHGTLNVQNLNHALACSFVLGRDESERAEEGFNPVYSDSEMLTTSDAILQTNAKGVLVVPFNTDASLLKSHGISMHIYAACMTKTNPVIPTPDPDPDPTPKKYNVVKYYEAVTKDLKTGNTTTKPIYYCQLDPSDYLTTPYYTINKEDSYKLVAVAVSKQFYVPSGETATTTHAKAMEDNNSSLLLSYAGDKATKCTDIQVNIDPSDPTIGTGTLILLFQRESTSTGINTYDNGGTDPVGPTPGTSPKQPGPTQDPDKYHGNIDIVKIYRDNVGSGPAVYASISKNASRNVTITQESQYTEYTLKEWFSSNKTLTPDMVGTKSTPTTNATSITTVASAPQNYTWETLKSSYNDATSTSLVYNKILSAEELKNTTFTHNLVIPDTDTAYKTLFLLYEKAPKSIIVQKHYCKNTLDNEVSTDPEETLSPAPTSYTVKPTNKDGYVYQESRFTPGSTSPRKASSVTYNIPSGTTRIDIYYLMRSSALILYANEISYGGYRISDMVEAKTLFKIYDEAPAVKHPTHSCDGHPCACGEHTYYCTWNNCTKDLTYSLTISDDTTTETNFIHSYKYTIEDTKLITGSWKADKNNATSGVNSAIIPNPTFILYRDKGKDKVTLYPTVNNYNISNSSIDTAYDLSAASYKPVGTRYHGITIMPDFSSDNFTDTFTLNFSEQHRDNTLYIHCSGSRGCKEANDKNSSAHNPNTVDGAMAYYNSNDNVTEYYYVGHQGTGNDVPNGNTDTINVDGYNDQFTLFSDSDPNGDHNNYNYQSSKGTVKVYPYNLMRIRESTSEHNKDEGTKIYTTSVNLSSIDVYEATQIGTYKTVNDGGSGTNKDCSINMSLLSTQWSTSNNSLNFEQNIDKVSVLPAGATLQLQQGLATVKNGQTDDFKKYPEGQTFVAIRQFTPFVSPELANAIAGSGVSDNYSASFTDANTQSENIFKSFLASMRGYHLVQRITDDQKDNSKDTIDDMLSSEDNYIGPNWKYPDIDYTSGGDFNGISEDSKYYLNDTDAFKNKSNYSYIGIAKEGTSASSARKGIMTEKDSKTNRLIYTIESNADGVITIKRGTEYKDSEKNNLKPVYSKKVSEAYSPKSVTSSSEEKALKRAILQDITGNYADLGIVDENTKLFTNFINSLDLGEGGSYYYRPNGFPEEYYNDGILPLGVIVDTYTIPLAFTEDKGLDNEPAVGGGFLRTVVTDPVLADSNTGKGSLYDFKSHKVRTSIFSLYPQPTISGAEKSTGYAGTVPVLSTIPTYDITLNNPAWLMYTKLFYIPNATVSDLN